MKLIAKNGKKVLCLLCVLTMVLSFSAGCSLGKRSQWEKIQSKAEKIQDIIDVYFLNDVDESNVEENVYKGLLNGLDDPYSVYYTEEEYTKLQEETAGTYVGIGVSVRQDTDTGYVKVVKAFEGGPAAEAGVKPNDYITKVKGEDIKDQDLDTVVSKIRGEEGTTVDVTFLRPSDGKSYTYTVERRSVDVPTINYEMLKDDIGYIQITEFDVITVEQYQKALADLEGQGMKGLIVDVRDNPGGVLGSVVEMLQNMLPKGTICYTEDKNGKGDTFTSDGTKEFKKPLVVLVNGNSASASEIFTGAIKDYGIGTIVGQLPLERELCRRYFR